MHKISILESHKCFDGTVHYVRHASDATGTEMTFSIFVPAQARSSLVPALTYLAGLTCTHETFMIKAGALKTASELGLMLIAPDTSPRGEDVPDDPEGAYDLGLGAGFYLNATQAPWSKFFQMESYITRDLQQAVFANFPGDASKQGLFGHSMGGHGALVLGLRYPDLYKSLSAFAPICAPARVPWGKKAFSAYLGENDEDWQRYDASEIIKSIKDARSYPNLLIDQGLDDQFLADQLHPHFLEEAAARSGFPLKLRRHPGYDHGYYFISTFMEDHLRHHEAILRS